MRRATHSSTPAGAARAAPTVGGSHSPARPCDIASRPAPCAHRADRLAAVPPAADAVVEAERAPEPCVPFGRVDQCAMALHAPHSGATMEAHMGA